MRKIIAWLPRDMELPEDEFRSRHMTLTVVLLLHVPVLIGYGLAQGADLVPLLIEVAFPLVAGLVGWAPNSRRRIRTFAVTTGLIYASIALLHISGGAAESSLHFLIMLAFVFLYRDWLPFVWSIGLMAAGSTVLSMTQGEIGAVGMTVGPPEMNLAALMTAAFFASIGLVFAWKSAVDAQTATTDAQENARERDAEAARRDAYGKMYVNLARRSQSLIDRQMGVIDAMEQQVEDPELLAKVFELDHLTTRVRRHGESLLVVADIDLPARSTEPVTLVDVVRGAQSEVEHYRRVNVSIDGAIAVEGSVVRDLVHLLAELLENATAYSPPTAVVSVQVRASQSGGVLIGIEDRGIGFTLERLAEVNDELRTVENLDEDSVRHLGLKVVGRLSAKHGIEVTLAATAGGGTTAWVDLPPAQLASGVPASLSTRVRPVAVAPTPAPPAPDTVAPDTVTPDVPSTLFPADEPVADPAPLAPAALLPLQGGFGAGGRGSSRRRRRATAARSNHESHPMAMPPAPPVTPPVAAPADEAPKPVAPTPQAPTPVTQAPVVPFAPPAPPAGPDSTVSAPMFQMPPTAATPVSAHPMPTLPKRERGATSHAARSEAMDLFGELDEHAGRSSLGAFQRGQQTARHEGDDA